MVNDIQYKLDGWVYFHSRKVALGVQDILNVDLILIDANC